MLSFLSFAFFFQASLNENFADVPPNHWAAKAVGVLKEAGLLSGYPDGLFRG